MDEYIEKLAKQLAEKLNEVLDLPFLNEEEEEMFFRLVVSTVFEIALGHVLDYLCFEEAK